MNYYAVNKYRRLYAPESSKSVPGRRRVLTERQEKVLVRNFKAGIYEEIPDAKRHLKEEYNVDLSVTAVRNVLKRNQMSSRSCGKKPLLKDRYRKARLAFARKYRSWTIDDWKRVV
ncbi:uncharacterized protein VTP21DRAFT_2582 [Calcarisporiella thermophila]|uniref:uncharacterized protein n=1 Tax=Calcarisporiella thermophila TaxID=911321 RepID=UPI0037433812